jgi:hypothetical protein
VSKEIASHTESLASARGYAAELIAVAVTIALGVNLLSSGLVPLIQASSSETTWAGALLILAGCVYLAWRTRPNLYRQVTGEAALVLRRNSEEFVPIDRYPVSEEIARYAGAIRAENKALYRILFPYQDSTDKERKISQPDQQLMCELLEHYVIKALSLHLGSYFTENEVEQRSLLVLLRNDIPDVLLQNRVLELLSRPMEQRDAFSEIKENPEGTIYYLIGAGGIIYERFELTLPPKSYIRRHGPATIEIRTDRFTMRIETKFLGYMTNLPRGFIELYMKENHEDVVAFQALIDIRVQFTWGSLLTGRGWAYYRWIDTFLKVLMDNFDKNRFVDRIGWENALTIARVMHRPKPRPAPKTEEERPQHISIVKVEQPSQSTPDGG